MSWFKPSPGDCTCICEGRTCADILAVISGVSMSTIGGDNCPRCDLLAGTTLFSTTPGSDCNLNRSITPGGGDCCIDGGTIDNFFITPRVTGSVQFNAATLEYVVTAIILIDVFEIFTPDPLVCPNRGSTGVRTTWGYSFERRSATIAGLLGAMTYLGAGATSQFPFGSAQQPNVCSDSTFTATVI